MDGACHCGNISFDLNWLPGPAEIPARRCACSFCRKHGGVWTSCRDGSLRVSVREPGRVSCCRSGAGTAEFHVCAACGVVPLVSSRIAGNVYAVVNVNAFEALSIPEGCDEPVSFDGEGEADRLARNWIGDVRFL
ncbi:hypothetical protein BI344_09885 [Chromobacterium sphagni]|uniref:CENP-V/GFA domain-containing protein n=1 Tax=Chromobacterium sphagni TaxID=1903179 RepID=A0ABX3CAL1_9NEIS|nr:hypothetical protein BI344_09885 [Chromobacterium sphagni]